MLKTERLFMQKPCFFVIFQCFFPDVRPDAPPDRRDTTHLGRAPEAHYRRTGQTGPRRAVRNVHSFVRILGGYGRVSFYRSSYAEGPAGGVQKYIF